MADTSSLWPGWQSVKPIGKGSFGTVYEIQRKLFDETEKAALKVITIPQSNDEIDALYGDGYDRDSVIRTYRQHLKDIVKEYSMMRKLSICQNIVNCDDVRYEQHTDGIGWDIFIKMELLTPLLKAFPGSMSEKLVIKAGKDLCRALIICKQYGVLHRDIKPQNIFVSNSGVFKLGDFGVAKTVESTMGGTKIGTYKYMAPEVYNNQPYGSAADLYSLGLLLYWMLNEHRLPFLPMPPAVPTHTEEEQARLRRFRGEPLPPPKHGSEALKAVVMKACAFDPVHRYDNATKLLAALESAEYAAAPKVHSVQTSTPPAAPDPDVTVRVQPVSPAGSKPQTRTPLTPKPNSGSAESFARQQADAFANASLDGLYDELVAENSQSAAPAPRPPYSPNNRSDIWESAAFRSPESVFDPDDEPSDRSLLWVPFAVLGFILTLAVIGFLLL